MTRQVSPHSRTTPQAGDGSIHGSDPRLPRLARSGIAGALAAAIVSALLAAGAPAHAEQNNECDAPGEAPDVVAGDITSRTRWGSIGGITAFSLGAASCNQGSCWLNFFAGTSEHPVTAQNMFRLEDGRFEQIGQSWVMHGFFALSQQLCTTGCLATNGSHLGVSCSNTDSANFDGYQPRLGPKFQIDPSTGVFPFPAAMNQSGDVIYKRLQVHDADLDPALHPGAAYWAEVQFVSRDDAAGGNRDNNASYRPIVVFAAGGTFDFTLTGATVREKPAIEAWKAAAPGVVLTNVFVPGDGRLIVGARVTPTGSGYHYEYAVQNLTSHRAAGSFSVPLPAGAAATGIGFHDVDYHSGEPFSGADWSAAVAGEAIVWRTETHEENLDANALRWGTIYNFRFDSPMAPTAGSVALGLFLPGDPGEVTAPTLVPSACAGSDLDADTHTSGCDCDDANPDVWAAPGEALALLIARDPGNAAALHWSAPLEPGGAAVAYDVIRTFHPFDFVTGAVCLPSPDPASLTRTDPEDPPPGAVFAYLVRARNGCPAGSGPLGTSSSGTPRAARPCI